MTDLNLLDRPQPPPPTYKTAVYKYVEYTPPVPPSANLHLLSFEHRGFIVERESDAFTWFIIKNKDASPLPLALRGSFTSSGRATQKIDTYLEPILREHQ